MDKESDRNHWEERLQGHIRVRCFRSFSNWP